MKALSWRSCAMAAALLPLVTAATSYAAAITQIRIYSCDSVGMYTGVDLWDTLPNNANYNLGLYQNLSSLRAGPTDTGASVNAPLTVGTSTLELAGSPGALTAHYDIQIYFDNAPLPQLSAIVSPTMPNVVNAVPLVGNSFLGGTNYTTGGMTYTLNNFQWMHPTVNNIDIVGAFDTGADGLNDYIGVFSLTVAPSIGQGIPEPASLGLLALGGRSIAAPAETLKNAGEIPAW